MSLPPTGPALARANRRVLAERLNWPAGHLEVCERLDQRYPGWRAWYADTVGFSAHQVADDRQVFGATEEALAAAIEEAHKPQPRRRYVGEY